MKHTKGPWTLVGKTICDEDGDSCIEILSGLNSDLKLIASAPELLEALEEVLRCGPHAGQNGDLLKQIEAVIKKAKGA